ncbi:MAG: SUMF1/EgtB/PvdO family nonheme iron enzyme [Phycisphaerae bacterium]|jgi:formylglycine-generating enzyme required for sulfatase activity|nr:SUMF1/EgtB/PvdO family nonheme iron enzyme [Phycisphaerae bacterium]
MKTKYFSTCRRHKAVLSILVVAGLLATLLAAPAAAATKSQLANIKRSVKLGPWYTSVELKCKLTTPEFAEKGIDLKAKAAGGKALWKTMSRVKDGAKYGLRMGGDSSRYFYRTITAKTPVTVTGGFGADDSCAVWLNGKKIPLAKAKRGPAGEAYTSKLQLNKGANELLIKVYNISGGAHIYFRVQELTKASSARRSSRRSSPPKQSGPDFTVESLERAIVDLSKSYPKKYAKGPGFLARLTKLKAAPDTAKLTSLAYEALLANPVLDFDKLLLVKRASGNKFLVNNWLSNTAIPKTGHTNEIAVLSPISPEGKITTIYKPANKAFVGDVDLHFDGTKMLFSMPNAKNHWHIFEVGVDGKNLRQVTPSEHNDVSNYDPCYLPDGNVMFTSTANMQGVPCIGGGSHVANMALYNPKTSKTRMLAFEQDHDWCPTIMPNGRVMYLRWEYTDTPHYFTRVMMTMNPDGTNQVAYYGSNSFWPNSLFFSRPIPGSSTKFVGIVGGHHGIPRMGEMVVFDTGKGTHEADGVVQRIPGYGKPVKPIIRDALVNGSWPLFIHPFPLDEKYYFASRPIKRGSKDWGIFLVDVWDNMLLVKTIPGNSLVEPVPLRATKSPAAIPSKLNPDMKDAILYVQSVYNGPGLKGVPKGTVKSMRVFTYTYGYRGMGGHTCFGTESGWDAKRILGTVPVHADGSAMFRVPANTPISLQPLDENGASLQLMRSWLTAMPGEALSCVGCHEASKEAPSPTRTMAGLKPPTKITPWNGPARGFGYRREVQPVIQKYCLGCHDGKEKGRPNLAAKRGGYDTLQLYVRRPGPESDYHMFRPMEYHSSTSELVQMFTKGHNNVKLPPEAMNRLRTWIDLNAPYHASWTESRGQKRVAGISKRYRELQKLYAFVDVDPEFMGDPPPTGIKPIVPKKLELPKITVPKVTGWPFDAAAAAKKQTAAGKETTQTIELADGVKMELRLVPAGEFVMGDSNGDLDERQVRHVRVGKSFWMGTCEVTNKQYAAFDAEHDSRFIDRAGKDQGDPGWPANGPEQPVIRISWDEANAFCAWLSKKSGKKISLPTEAQWEWACRAGTNTAMSCGAVDSDYGKFANLADASAAKRLGTGRGNLTPFITDKTFNDGQMIVTNVGKYTPNAWGLKDMHGNVAEWTRSAFKAYPYNGADGRNDTSAKGAKVVRGGSWHDRAKRSTSSYRMPYQSHQKVYSVGFRVICEAK